ncbi:MAG TPA: hypothetical protein VGW40_06525 [Allosphingosinicella sp.]|nr:hypothetical protein [Allosphingosinicella sp.]
MNAPYVRLGIILALAGFAMFTVLSATIGVPGGLNPVILCITLMMVAPLGVVLLLILPHLYRSLRANLLLYAGFTCLFLGAWAATHIPALAGDQVSLRAAATQQLSALAPPAAFAARP